MAAIRTPHLLARSLAIGAESAQLSASLTDAQGRITFFLSFQQPGSFTMCMLPHLCCSYCNSPWTGTYCETKA